MKPVECEREAEVLAVVLQDRWPERADDVLRTHVATCEICSDVVAIAGAIDDAREEMRAQAAVPDSGRVWWLAQMRARREASRAAGRPITAVQVIAFACAMGLLGACFGATSAWFQSALHRTAMSLAALRFQTFLAFASEHAFLFLGMGAILLAVPAACLTILRE